MTSNTDISKMIFNTDISKNDVILYGYLKKQ